MEKAKTIKEYDLAYDAMIKRVKKHDIDMLFEQSKQTIVDDELQTRFINSKIPKPLNDLFGSKLKEISTKKRLLGRGGCDKLAIYDELKTDTLHVVRVKGEWVKMELLRKYGSIHITYEFFAGPQKGCTVIEKYTNSLSLDACCANGA